MEKEFDEFVAKLNRAKARTLCPRGLLDGCGETHMQVDSAVLRELLVEFLEYTYDSSVAIYDSYPRRVVKNHIVSKTVLGKGVQYKIIDPTMPTIVVTPSSGRFTMNAKFGDVFEIFCGQIETLWGIKRDTYFTEKNEVRPEFMKYYTREYFSLKMMMSLIHAIHKVRSDNTDVFLVREEAIAQVMQATLQSFRSVSWLINHHPQRESNLIVPLTAREITQVSYGEDDGSGSRVGFLLPLGRYGYLETVNDGFGMMGSLFMHHNVFDRKGSSIDAEDKVSLSENAELWVGKACRPSGEIRVFYLEEDFTYRTAVVDAHSSRTTWMKYDFQIDPKRLSFAMSVYEQQHIAAGRGAIRKTLSQKNVPKPPTRRELRKAKKKKNGQ